MHANLASLAAPFGPHAALVDFMEGPGRGAEVFDDSWAALECVPCPASVGKKGLKESANATAE